LTTKILSNFAFAKKKKEETNIMDMKWM